MVVIAHSRSNVLKNNLLMAMGFLEFVNATDSAANVSSTIAVPNLLPRFWDLAERLLYRSFHLPSRMPYYAGGIAE